MQSYTSKLQRKKVYKQVFQQQSLSLKQIIYIVQSFKLIKEYSVFNKEMETPPGPRDTRLSEKMSY